MEKLLVLVISTVGSGIGWWAGARVGIMTAFFCSVVGLAIGVWGGRRLARIWLP